MPETKGFDWDRFWEVVISSLVVIGGLLGSIMWISAQIMYWMCVVVFAMTVGCVCGMTG